MVRTSEKARTRANHVLKATELKRRAGCLIALRVFPDALALLKEAHQLFPTLKDKARCASQMAYCKKKVRGIDDWRDFDLGIWYGDKEITASEMHRILNTKSSDVRYESKARRGRVSIKDVVFNELENNEEDEVTLESVLPLVLDIKPDSKFSDSHLAFYKSKFRNKNKGK